MGIEVESLHRQILLTREKVPGTKHADTVSNVAYLVDLLKSRDEYEEAESLHRQIFLLRRFCDIQYQRNQ